MPLPKPAPRVIKHESRKRGKTTILPDAPERKKIKIAHVERETKRKLTTEKQTERASSCTALRCQKKTKPRGYKTPQKRSDISELAETYTTGDYVIVKFAGKAKLHNYIGLIVRKTTVEILKRVSCEREMERYIMVNQHLHSRKKTSVVFIEKTS